MNTAVRPVDNGALARCCVVGAPGGWRLAWARNGGLSKEPFGSTFSSVRRACTASIKRNEEV